MEKVVRVALLLAAVGAATGVGGTSEDDNMKAMEICIKKLKFDSETLENIMSKPPSEDDENSRCLIECTMQSHKILMKEYLDLLQFEKYMIKSLSEANDEVGPRLPAEFMDRAKSCGLQIKEMAANGVRIYKQGNFSPLFLGGKGKCATGFKIWKCLSDLTLPYDHKKYMAGNEVSSKGRGVCACVPKRVIIAVMASTGILVQFMLKVSMSVIIVAMVKSGGTCPPRDNSTSGAAGRPDCHEDEGEFEWSGSMQGFVLSAFYYGYVTTQVLGGWLSDRFGPKYVMGCGVAAGGACMMLAPVAARLSVYAFAAVRIVIGAFAGMFFPPLQDLFSKWFPPEEHQKTSGMMYSTIYLANMISMCVTGVLCSYNWELAFYVYGSLCILWFVPWVFLVYDSPDQHPTISLEERNHIMKHAKFWDSNKKKEKRVVPWKDILTSLPVWAQILVQVGGSYVSYTIMSELPTYMKQVLHFNVQKSGMLSALPYLFGGIACMMFGAISQWLQKNEYTSRKTAYYIFNGISCFGPAACLVALAFVEGTTSTVALMVCILVLFNAYYGGSFTNLLDLAINYVGIITGIQLTFSNTTGILSAQVAGLLTDGKQTHEQWAKVFYIAAGIIAPPYIFFLFFGSVEEQPWNKQGDDDDEETPPDPEILQIKMSIKKQRISIDQFPNV